MINILKKKAFCYHIVKFDKMKIKLMKIIFINNIKNAILEEKYKKIYMNRKFNLLVINRVIKYGLRKKSVLIWVLARICLSLHPKFKTNIKKQYCYGKSSVNNWRNWTGWIISE